MNPSAPRCQTKYLKWLCENSEIAFNDSTANNFVMPESEHATTPLPPQPFMVIAKDSYVSMCGQIVGHCGLVHTTANCMATGYKSIGQSFKNKCTMDIAAGLGASGRPTGTKFSCADGTPFGNEVVVQDRVFVVAQVDDTYTYHIHLEMVPRIVFHLDFLIANPDIKILVSFAVAWVLTVVFIYFTQCFSCRHVALLFLCCDVLVTVVSISVVDIQGRLVVIPKR